jgi:hypothetical protein
MMYRQTLDFLIRTRKVQPVHGPVIYMSVSPNHAGGCQATFQRRVGSDFQSMNGRVDIGGIQKRYRNQREH